MLMPARALPDDVIDRLFSALTMRYGVPFLDRWRDLDLAAVKGDWARELSGFASNLQAIRYGLDHLPEKPPTVIEFRRICNSAPRTEVPLALTHNGRVRGPSVEERELLTDLLARPFNRPSKDWAHRLLDRHARGDRRPPACVAMAKAAVASPTATSEDE
jgi:hypothetical protein